MSLEVSFSQVFNRLGVSFFFFFLSPKGLESPICRFFVWFSEVTFLIVQGHRLSDSTRKLTLCHTTHILDSIYQASILLIPCILFCSGFPIVASPTRFWLGFSKIVEVSVSGLGVSASLGSSYHLPPLNLPVIKFREKWTNLYKIRIKCYIVIQ